MQNYKLPFKVGTNIYCYLLIEYMRAVIVANGAAVKLIKKSEKRIDVLYFCIAQKSGNILLAYCAKRMFPIFRAIVKFCSTNRLFTLFLPNCLDQKQ